jgi:hypothetical protein
MNLKTLLKLLGFDLKKPLDTLLKLVVMLDDGKLIDEVKSVMCLKMSAARKTEVAMSLRKAADALDANDCATFGKTFVGILKSIKI